MIYFIVIPICIDNWKDAAQRLSVEDVCQFLKKFKLEYVIEKFKEEDVDGASLSEVVSERNNEFLKCLGVTSPVHMNKIFVKFPKFCSEYKN